ncbi:MAG TPA: YjfB family protein [Oscillatoriaceae cyanobacterium]
MPDISNVLSTDASNTHMKYGLSMLRRGMDMEQSQMSQLLNMLPNAPQPGHLGQSVDTHA